MAWCRTFQKCILYNLLDNFFADSKSRAQELSNNVYICHIWRSNMGFRVGITLTPPPVYPGFLSIYPSRIGLMIFYLHVKSTSNLTGLKEKKVLRWCDTCWLCKHIYAWNSKFGEKNTFFVLKTSFFHILFSESLICFKGRMITKILLNLFKKSAKDV